MKFKREKSLRTVFYAISMILMLSGCATNTRTVSDFCEIGDKLDMSEQSIEFLALYDGLCHGGH